MRAEMEIGGVQMLGAMSQGMWAASRRWKGRETDSPLGLPETHFRLRSSRMVR